MPKINNLFLQCILKIDDNIGYKQLSDRVSGREMIRQRFITKSISSNNQVHQYQKQPLELSVSGNNNQLILENCQFRVHISGNSNKIMILTQGQHSNNFDNEIKIQGNQNYVGVGGGKISLHINGNRNQIQGQTKDVVISQLNGFGNKISKPSQNKSEPEEDRNILNLSPPPSYPANHKVDYVPTYNSYQSYRHRSKPEQQQKSNTICNLQNNNDPVSKNSKKEHLYDRLYKQEQQKRKEKIRINQTFESLRATQDKKQQNIWGFPRIQNSPSMLQSSNHNSNRLEDIEFSFSQNNRLQRGRRHSQSQAVMYNAFKHHRGLVQKQNNPQEDNNEHRQIPRLSLFTCDDDPKPLSESEIKRLPESVHQGNPVNCHICLEDVVIGQNQTFLFCFHSYHSTCINAWMKKNCKCPFCFCDVRKQIQEASKYNK